MAETDNFQDLFNKKLDAACEAEMKKTPLKVMKLHNVVGVENPVLFIDNKEERNQGE